METSLVENPSSRTSNVIHLCRRRASRRPCGRGRGQGLEAIGRRKQVLLEIGTAFLANGRAERREERGVKRERESLTSCKQSFHGRAAPPLHIRCRGISFLTLWLNTICYISCVKDCHSKCNERVDNQQRLYINSER